MGGGGGVGGGGGGWGVGGGGWGGGGGGGGGVWWSRDSKHDLLWCRLQITLWGEIVECSVAHAILNLCFLSFWNPLNSSHITMRGWYEPLNHLGGRRRARSWKRNAELSPGNAEPIIGNVESSLGNTEATFGKCSCSKEIFERIQTNKEIYWTALSL